MQSREIESAVVVGQKPLGKFIEKIICGFEANESYKVFNTFFIFRLPGINQFEQESIPGCVQMALEKSPF